MGLRSNLGIFRLNRGLKVREVGDQANIPFSYISAFERGRMVPYPDEVEKICKVLSVTFEDAYPDPAIRKIITG